jgi:hypothetical protein
MTIPKGAIQKLNAALGLVARPHYILYQGQWIDTGCLKWSPFLDVPTIMSEASPDLKDALRRSQDYLSQQPPTYNSMAALYEFFSKESIRVQDEALEYISKMEKASPQAIGPIDDWLRTARTMLAETPVIAYKGNLSWFSMTSTISDCIVAAPTTDQFDILRFERTDGSNRGLTTEGVITQIKTLDERFGVNITGASQAAVEFILERIPNGKAARALGKLLFSICPDIYEVPKTFPTGKVALWWD